MLQFHFDCYLGSTTPTRQSEGRYFSS